jgi:hypothetical protein
MGLLCLVLAVLASPFKSKSRLEGENAVLRHQLMVLRRRLHGRVRFTNHDRWFLIQLYRWFPSILQVLAIIRRPGRPERNRAVRSFGQLRRFHHGINSDKVFGTHSRRTTYGRLSRNSAVTYIKARWRAIGEGQMLHLFRRTLPPVCLPHAFAARSDRQARIVSPKFRDRMPRQPSGAI